MSVLKDLLHGITPRMRKKIDEQVKRQQEEESRQRMLEYQELLCRRREILAESPTATGLINIIASYLIKLSLDGRSLYISVSEQGIAANLDRHTEFPQNVYDRDRAEYLFTICFNESNYQQLASYDVEPFTDLLANRLQCNLSNATISNVNRNYGNPSYSWFKITFFSPRKEESLKPW